MIAMAVDRGLLQYDAPVAQYWAEFGSQGKENITVAQLMRHQAGLVILSSPLPLSLLKPGQEDRLATVLAQSPLNWSPDMEDKWPRQAHMGSHRGPKGVTWWITLWEERDRHWGGDTREDIEHIRWVHGNGGST